MIRKTLLAILLASPLLAQNALLSDSQAAQAREAGKGDEEYQRGLSALDSQDWDEAIEAFSSSASAKHASAPAALYWLAYAQNRDGRRSDALSTLAQLKRQYPDSRWTKDAQALDAEVRAQNGSPVNPADESDNDLKLLALNGLMQSEPDQAFPILQKLLAGKSSDKIKERALFVLVQNPNPQAAKLLADMARGTTDPGLQTKAIRYIGMMGGESSRKELQSVYTSSNSEQVKRAILQSFMISGSRDSLFNVAKTESNPELRREAIRQLAISGGQDQLWQLYKSENSLENKREILKSMFLTGDSEKLSELARSEKDPTLRASAIKSLGLMGGNGRGDVLVSIFKSDTNPEVRHEVLQALFLQGNGKALVDLARNEKDPEMKRQIVQKMSLVHSKEVTDYMMELLK